MISKNVKQQKKDLSKAAHGTKEWSVKSVNCCNGCSHDCKYCYAKEDATHRYKRFKPEEWSLERLRQKDVDKAYKKIDGQIMFPSTHDITPDILKECMTVLEKLLKVGNQVLIVSKPHYDCIREICKKFEPYKHQILFRFTIGACDDRILSYWEPGAPSYSERKASLKYTFDQGFRTSVSVEPMLDSANIDALISDLSPYLTHSIWIGTMNHLGRLEKYADNNLKKEIRRIRRGQTDSVIKAIYDRHNGNPLIRWKKEIKKIVGIPIPKQNGLDI